MITLEYDPQVRPGTLYIDQYEDMCLVLDIEKLHDSRDKRGYKISIFNITDNHEEFEPEYNFDEKHRDESERNYQHFQILSY